MFGKVGGVVDSKEDLGEAPEFLFWDGFVGCEDGVCKDVQLGVAEVLWVLFVEVHVEHGFDDGD